MSLACRVRPLAILVAALAVFTLALALAPRSPAHAASTTEVTYSLANVTAAAPTCDVPPCQVFTAYNFSGTQGTTTTAGAPAVQSYSWVFRASKTASSNSCAFTQGTGSMAIIWQDATTTDVTFSFKARDAHTWVIKGQVTGGTNTAFPPSPNTPASGVVGYPPNPCNGATVTATLDLFPPQPI